ncbi:MAG: serine/threonine protein kinase [Myxococcales bacterium]|nr:serine/threonine protein kinase [Myxococcales bacterium]
MESGQTVGKYQVGARVGQGGMSVVFRGRDTVLGRDVAIKVLHQHLAESHEAKARFDREAKAVARLRHANILEIYDYSGNDVVDHYIISEFIEGKTLKHIIEQRPIALPEIGAAIVWQLAVAVGHAHEMGVLHRDLKPENVMVRQDGVIKLTDFGIAHVLELGKLTVTGQLLGSPAYMAPEHVEGRALSAQTDIFSLGTILYQLCVGELPFCGTNAHEILLKIADGRFVDPVVANPAIGNELGHIIRTALAVDPAARYVSACAMADALERYITASGLPEVRHTCAAYFANPSEFTASATGQVVAALAARAATASQRRNRAACIDIERRLRALAPGHPAIAKLSHANRVRSLVRRVALGAGALALAMAGWIAFSRSASPPPAASPSTSLAITRLFDNARATRPTDAALPLPSVPRPSTERPAMRNARPAIRPFGKKTEPPPVSSPVLGSITLQVSPANSLVQIDGAPWRQLSGGRIELAWSGKPIRVEGRNETCCENAQRTLHASDVGATVGLALSFLPARVIPQCAAGNVTVQINGRPARLGGSNIITFGDSTQTRQSVTVEFIGERVTTKRIVVRANETVTVPCDATPR